MDQSLPISKKSRNVRFAQVDTVHPVESCSQISASEKIQAWYDREELTNMKRRALMEARSRKGTCVVETIMSDVSFYKCLDSSYTIPSTNSNGILVATASEAESFVATRGLETRIITERCKYRQIARLAVLETQRRLKKRSCHTNEEKKAFVAKISKKFSRWAKEIAHRVAAMDAHVANDSVAEKLSFATCRQELFDLPLLIDVNARERYPAAKRMRMTDSHDPLMTMPIICVPEDAALRRKIVF